MGVRALGEREGNTSTLFVVRIRSISRGEFHCRSFDIKDWNGQLLIEVGKDRSGLDICDDKLDGREEELDQGHILAL